MVEQGGFTGRLRAKHRNQVVVESCLSDFCGAQITRQMFAVEVVSIAGRIRPSLASHILEILILVDDLDPMLILLFRWRLADVGKVSIDSHD